MKRIRGRIADSQPQNPEDTSASLPHDEVSQHEPPEYATPDEFFTQLTQRSDIRTILKALAE